MDSKEQSKQIIEKFSSVVLNQRQEPVELAKICVQLIIRSNPHCNPFNNDVIVSTMAYWKMVLKELNKPVKSK